VDVDVDVCAGTAASDKEADKQQTPNKHAPTHTGTARSRKGETRIFFLLEMVIAMEIRILNDHHTSLFKGLICKKKP